MRILLYLILANVAAFAMEYMRLRRLRVCRRNFEGVRLAAVNLAAEGWAPLRWQWQGRLRTRPILTCCHPEKGHCTIQVADP